MSDIVERLATARNMMELERAAADAIAEIERLREELLTRNTKLRHQAEEIERLRIQVTQRGAKMQVMHKYMLRYSGPRETLWHDFLRVYQHAAAWFDDNGVPK